MEDSQQQESALASLYYCLVRGLSVSEDRAQLAIKAWRRVSMSPWTDAAVESNGGVSRYLGNFAAAYKVYRPFVQLCDSWRTRFDASGWPKPSADVREFLRQALRIQMHSPHRYHELFCISPDFHGGGIMDFAVTHPIADDFWTICFTRSGAGVIRSASQEVNLEVGSAALIPPKFSGTIERDVNCEHWHCFYLGFRARPQWVQLLQWAYPMNSPMVLRMSALEQNRFTEVLAEISTTPYSPGDLSENLCFNLIANLLIRINRLGKWQLQNEFQHRGVADLRVAAAADYVLENYAQNFCIETVAAQATLSVSRLSSLFKQQYGMSVIEWRDAIRISVAKRLLADTLMTVGEVAAQIGFDDQLYFSRWFRRHANCSPSDFRGPSK